MSVSEKIGGLPILSEVWNHGPIFAAVVMIVVDFGAICALMWLEGLPPWKRQHYKTFLWNDTVFIPLWMAMVVVILERSPPMAGWHTEAWWHWTALLGAFAVSTYLEIDALRNGQYTWSQELSPSKLWHTFIFGIVGYWLASTLVPILVARSSPDPVWAGLGVAVGICGFAYNMYRDATIKPPPWNAHLEGTYFPWRWEERKKE